MSVPPTPVPPTWPEVYAMSADVVGSEKNAKEAIEAYTDAKQKAMMSGKYPKNPDEVTPDFVTVLRFNIENHDFTASLLFLAIKFCDHQRSNAWRLGKAVAIQCTRAMHKHEDASIHGKACDLLYRVLTLSGTYLTEVVGESYSMNTLIHAVTLHLEDRNVMKHVVRTFEVIMNSLYLKDMMNMISVCATLDKIANFEYHETRANGVSIVASRLSISLQLRAVERVAVQVDRKRKLGDGGPS